MNYARFVRFVRFHRFLRFIGRTCVRVPYVQTSNEVRGCLDKDVVLYRGVSRRGNRFRARIKCRSVLTSLGWFDTAEEAARAYDHARVLNGLHTFNFRGSDEPIRQVIYVYKNV